jgi:hypothetical protein
MEPWKREDWVVSRTGFRVLNVTFLAEFVGVFVLLSISVLLLAGKPAIPTYLPLRILLSLVGGIGALSSLILSDAMKAFGNNRRRIGERTTNLWRIGWILPIFGPPLLYFLLVYRPKMKESGFS